MKSARTLLYTKYNICCGGVLTASKRKNSGSIIVKLLVFGVSVYFIVVLSSLWSTLNTRRETLAELNAQYAAEQREVENLKSLLKEGSLPEIIEKAARERLGYVYSDEEVYIDISGN